MDDFNKAGMNVIGPGGMKCNCCNCFKVFGAHARKLPGFSKLRRTRLKRQTIKEVQRVVAGFIR